MPDLNSPSCGLSRHIYVDDHDWLFSCSRIYPLRLVLSCLDLLFGRWSRLDDGRTIPDCADSSRGIHGCAGAFVHQHCDILLVHVVAGVLQVGEHDGER